MPFPPGGALAFLLRGFRDGVNEVRGVRAGPVAPNRATRGGEDLTPAEFAILWEAVSILLDYAPYMSEAFANQLRRIPAAITESRAAFSRL